MLSSEESDDDNASQDVKVFCTPPNLFKEAISYESGLLSEKSKHRYEQCYEKFIEWQHKQETSSFSETEILAYFENLSNLYKSSTLWSIYSMLKSTIELKNNIDISKYMKLKLLLKRKAIAFTPKKSATLTSQQVNEFLYSAPDSKYLLTKLACAIGIAGACRSNELWNLRIHQVKDLGSTLLFEIPDSKTNMTREFTMTGPFLDLYKKYTGLRPTDCSDKLFLNYQNGKCFRQNVGKNKIGNMPSEIASFLKLKDPKSYTGHCFRRSSATLIADSGCDFITIIKHEGLSSSSVEEECIDSSSTTENAVANRIVSLIQPTSTDSSPIITNNCTIQLNTEINNQFETENNASNAIKRSLANVIRGGTFNNCTINISFNK